MTRSNYSDIPQKRHVLVDLLRGQIGVRFYGGVSVRVAVRWTSSPSATKLIGLEVCRTTRTHLPFDLFRFR